MRVVMVGMMRGTVVKATGINILIARKIHVRLKHIIYNTFNIATFQTLFKHSLDYFYSLLQLYEGTHLRSTVGFNFNVQMSTQKIGQPSSYNFFSESSTKYFASLLYRK